MAKEIDKIIQSKTAPKSNNVLWDDGKDLKISRNGKWESTGSGTSIPYEKLDTIDFGYYTYASGNVVANWGPFTIKEGETITVDTNVTAKPKYIKVHDFSRITYVEKGSIHELIEHLDGTLTFYGIQIKPQGTTLEIYNDSALGTVTISFLCYKKQDITNETHSMSYDFIRDFKLTSEIRITPGYEIEDILKLIGKHVCIHDKFNFQDYYGFCFGLKTEYYDNYSYVVIYLLDFPNVKVVKVLKNNQMLVESISSEDKEIAVV